TWQAVQTDPPEPSAKDDPKEWRAFFRQELGRDMPLNAEYEAEKHLATAPAQWMEPEGPRAGGQHDRARVDQLLRAVPPVGAVSQPPLHQRLSGAVGRAEVQAVPGQVEAGTGGAAE